MIQMCLPFSFEISKGSPGATNSGFCIAFATSAFASASPSARAGGAPASAATTAAASKAPQRPLVSFLMSLPPSRHAPRALARATPLLPFAACGSGRLLSRDEAREGHCDEQRRAVEHLLHPRRGAEKLKPGHS